MKRIRKITALLLALALLAAAAGCGAGQNTGENANGTKEADSASRDFFAMDTYMSVLAYGDGAEEAVAEAVAEVNRLDALFSTGNPDSEVFRVNRDGGGTLSADGSALMEASLALWEETGGAFDVCIYPLMELWGFTDRNYRVPAQEEIDAVLPLADASRIRFEGGETAFALEGMKIDFGGIAKGYTSSAIVDIFRQNGIGSGLVSLGGNVHALGVKPDGTPWKIGIQDPENSGGMIGVLAVADRAVITSGGYERCFEEDGTVYHHIIDPKTGYPARSGLLSVTVVSADGTLADGLSTALFVMGLDRAEAFWRERRDRFDAVFVTEDGSLYITEGLKDTFTSDRKFEVCQGVRSR